MRRLIRNRYVLIALTAALLVAIVAVVKRGPRSGDPGAWPANTTSTYRVEWRTRASATMSIEGRAEMGSDVQARGDLLVRSYGAKDGETLLGVRWGKLESASAVVMGREIVSADELMKQLQAADAVVRVTATGRVVDLRFAPDAAPLARSIVRALVLELCAQVATASGEGVVETALGRAEVTRTGNGATVRTERKRYDSLEAFPDGIDPTSTGSLDANGQVDIDGDRSVRSIRSTENVAIQHGSGPMEAFASTTELVASLVGRDEKPLGAPPDYAPAELRGGKHGEDDGFDRKASLTRRSMGVTYESVAADVRMAGALPKAGATAWIWHDSAFLELHPEYASKLLDQASREFILNQQAAAFDIVVVSGTPEGQKALEAALRGWASEGSLFITLVQRVGYLRQPTLDTLAFVEGEYAKNRATNRGYACAFTLGALAAAAREKYGDRANAIVATLTGDLAHTSDDTQREELLRALGNAGFESTVEAIVTHRASPSARVRAAVASALRRPEGPLVVDALLDLSTDADRVVATTAFASLFRKTLDDDAWARLHRAFDDGKISEGAQEALLTGLSSHRGESPQVTALLVAIVASPNATSQVKQRAESVLRQQVQ
jgi:hypothetical protein